MHGEGREHASHAVTAEDLPVYLGSLFAGEAQETLLIAFLQLLGT